MAKLQLTPDWMIGPKNAGKAVALWLTLAIVVVIGFWYLSSGGLAAVGEVGNQTIEVTDSTDSVWVDIETNENATDSDVATIAFTNESSGTEELSETTTLASNTTVSETFDADDLNGTANYTVTVEAEETAVENVTVGVTDESGGVAGAVEGNEAEVGVGVLAIVAILAGIVLARDES